MNLDYNQLMCLKISAHKFWSTFDTFSIDVYPSSKVIDITIEKYIVSFYGEIGVLELIRRNPDKILITIEDKPNTFYQLDKWLSFTADYNVLKYTEQKSRNQLNKFLKLGAFL